MPFGTASPDHAALDAEMVRRSWQWFEEPEFRVFRHGRSQTTEEWLAELATHSPVARLPSAVREALFDDLRSALVALNGGMLRVEYETRLTATRRR